MDATQDAATTLVIEAGEELRRRVGESLVAARAFRTRLRRDDGPMTDLERRLAYAETLLAQANEASDFALEELARRSAPNRG